MHWTCLGLVYTSLIRGLCIKGWWDDLLELMKEMEERFIPFDVKAYNVLVDGLCMEGRIEDYVRAYSNSLKNFWV